MEILIYENIDCKDKQQRETAYPVISNTERKSRRRIRRKHARLFREKTCKTSIPTTSSKAWTRPALVLLETKKNSIVKK